MTENRTEKLNKVIEWAKATDEIRVMLLTSSLTNPDAAVDIFSDLDIEFVVLDLDKFLSDDSWLSNFGEIVTIIIENEEVDGNYAMRMVFYEDYTKIDFTIYSVDKFKAQVANGKLFEHWDIGYKVLLDKDELTKNLKQPTYKSFIISKPTQEEFQFVFNNFWWDMTYVAKCLWRDELFYAKFVSEQIMRFENLQKIIEWYIGLHNDWKVTTNKYGRLFKKYLAPEMWKKVEATFAGGDIEDNWRALFAYADLGRELGFKIAQKLDYKYPMELDKKIRAYIEEVQSLDRNIKK